MRRGWLLPILSVAIAIFVAWCIRFYPQQMVDADCVSRINVKTPDSTKYYNDCLHPCIRYYEKDFAGYNYWMSQSPYYAGNNKIENPLLYHIPSWNGVIMSEWGRVVEETPSRGYNSDPYIFRDGSMLYVFWRECFTPFCDSIGAPYVTVGVSSHDGIHFSPKKVYLINNASEYDMTQCPILMKYNGKYCFYAVSYQYEPRRQNNGIAIWEGSSLEQPDFELKEIMPLNNLYVCDKKAEIRLAGHHYYLPWPKKYDLWHFDLLEYNNKLYMISCDSEREVIVLFVSDDWRHFKSFKKPLVNNLYMQNYCGYRQYYYKPTAFVKNDTLQLFWTSNDEKDGDYNVLWSSKLEMHNLE